MTDLWIGTCILSSGDPAGRFWTGGAARVSLRMLMRADSADGFERALRRSVQTAGAVVEQITQIETVAARYAGRDLSEAMHAAVAQANRETPLMISTPKAVTGTHQITEISWSDVMPGPDLWALLDGVQWPGLPQLLATSGAEHTCLYTSTDVQSLAAAPWLVRLDAAGGAFRDVLMQRPCDSHSGILFRAQSTLHILRKHLRHYTMVPTPIGGEVPQYFRFYDPRVMMDGLTALSPDLLAQMVRPLSALIVPLSPHSLLPDSSGISSPPTVFDRARDCQDRLALVTWAPADTPALSQRIVIDKPSFDRFGILQKQRAIGDLARQLHEDYGDGHSAQDCLHAAQDAPEVAGKFGMNSLKQVTAVARAILQRGPAFWERDSAAHDLLTQPGRLPWQRKDDLVAWLDQVGSAHTELMGEMR